jgi:hypothetical protein
MLLMFRQRCSQIVRWPFPGNARLLFRLRRSQKRDVYTDTFVLVKLGELDQS